MTTTEKIKRLPKWAQDHIHRLTVSLIEAEGLIDQLKNADPRDPVAVRDPYAQEIPVAWSDYDTIRFFTEDGQDYPWIDVRRRDAGAIEIMASGTLSVRCRSGNVFTVSAER